MEHPSNLISRVLAVAGLIAAFVALILVIGSAGSDYEGASTTQNPSTVTERPQKPKTRAKVYVVKEGDSLSTIAERTGIPVDQLQKLNPDLDPQALTIGQKLKLR